MITFHSRKKICKLSSAIIAQNKHAYHKYSVIREFETGLSLQGWEVKSIRAGKVNISDSYVIIKNSEAYLFGATIQPLIVASSHVNYDPIRIRRLLLNKYELDSLYGRVHYDGYTIIALSLYWKNTWIKTKIGIAKGKKKYDQRINIKEREWQLDKSRILKYNNR